MYVGIDLGSRTIKAAALEGGRLLDFRVVESGFDPHRQALELIRPYHPRRIIATGYGRHLARRHFAEDVVTEIKAHAIGARHFFPNAGTVVDIGGQDSKVISLKEDGGVLNFHMNDKCAAGTGRFLEIMASSLGYTLDEFSIAALEASEAVPINSMCAVFAESEVISLKNHGTPPEKIARAVHLSVVQRLLGMIHRAGAVPEVAFTGGVARNRAMVRLLEEHLDMPLMVCEHPDIAGAVGAAVHAEAMDAVSQKEGG